LAARLGYPVRAAVIVEESTGRMLIADIFFR
jgi:hypothetical protein